VVDDCDERNDNERDEIDVDMFVLDYISFAYAQPLIFSNVDRTLSTPKICHARGYAERMIDRAPGGHDLAGAEPELRARH
jgi:hypothetical protein